MELLLMAGALWAMGAGKGQAPASAAAPAKAPPAKPPAKRGGADLGKLVGAGAKLVGVAEEALPGLAAVLAFPGTWPILAVWAVGLTVFAISELIHQAESWQLAEFMQYRTTEELLVDEQQNVKDILEARGIHTSVEWVEDERMDHAITSRNNTFGKNGARPVLRVAGAPPQSPAGTRPRPLTPEEADLRQAAQWARGLSVWRFAQGQWAQAGVHAWANGKTVTAGSMEDMPALPLVDGYEASSSEQSRWADAVPDTSRRAVRRESLFRRLTLVPTLPNGPAPWDDDQTKAAWANRMARVVFAGLIGEGVELDGSRLRVDGCSIDLVAYREGKDAVA